MGAGSFSRSVTGGRPRGSAVEGAHHAEGAAVDVALGATDEDLAAVEVDVLDADTEAFEEVEAAAVEELSDEAEGGLELVEDGERVAAGGDVSPPAPWPRSPSSPG